MNRILSTIDLGGVTDKSKVEILPLDHQKNLVLQLFKLLVNTYKYDVILLNNPDKSELVYVYLAKIIYSKRVKIIAVDLILRKPYNLKSLIISKLKSIFLKKFDLVLMFSKDTTGYQKYFGLSKDIFQYIPFKPNNTAWLDKISSMEGDYIVSLGTSQRDYMVLINALESLNLKTKIIASLIGIETNHSEIKSQSLPSCITHISEKVSYEEWNTLIAHSKFVVVPIIRNTIQPAGVSVYLEAMAMGKAVIVTKGASTNDILDDSLAELVEEGNVQSMEVAIKNLWYNTERRKELESNSLKYAASLKNHNRLLSDIRNVLDNV